MEENKLIAEFMGAKPIVLGNSTEYEMYGIIECINDGVDEKHFFIADEMEYHKSWDWLMPVVEKIESLGYAFEKNYQRVDKDWQSLIVKGHDILYQEFNDDGLKSSYYVVVEFIKQYNNGRV